MVSHPENGSDSPIGSDRDRGRDTENLWISTKFVHIDDFLNMKPSPLVLVTL